MTPSFRQSLPFSSPCLGLDLDQSTSVTPVCYLLPSEFVLVVVCGLDSFQEFTRRLSSPFFFNCVYTYLLFPFWAFLSKGKEAAQQFRATNQGSSLTRVFSTTSLKRNKNAKLRKYTVVFGLVFGVAHDSVHPVFWIHEQFSPPDLCPPLRRRQRARLLLGSLSGVHVEINCRFLQI